MTAIQETQYRPGKSGLKEAFRIIKPIAKAGIIFTATALAARTAFEVRGNGKKPHMTDAQIFTQAATKGPVADKDAVGEAKYIPELAEQAKVPFINGTSAALLSKTLIAKATNGTMRDQADATQQIRNFVHGLSHAVAALRRGS